MAVGVCHCWAASKHLLILGFSLTDRHHFHSPGPYLLSFLVKTWVLSTELQWEIFGTVIRARSTDSDQTLAAMANYAHQGPRPSSYYQQSPPVYGGHSPGPRSPDFYPYPVPPPPTTTAKKEPPSRPLRLQRVLPATGIVCRALPSQVQPSVIPLPISQRSHFYPVLAATTTAYVAVTQTAV